MVRTYEDNELREKVAFSQLKVNSIEEIENDEQKMSIYNRFMNELKMPDTYKEGDET